jgi:hypothetical protein
MKKCPLFLVLVLLAVTGGYFALAQDADAETGAKIENAMSAAPLSIAQDATILDWVFDDEGKFIVLREGTNGWSCLPGNPKPMCLDEIFMEWLYAVITGEDLTVTAPGFAYMLQGGEALSNSNPAAMEPAEDHWMSSSPYMMVLLPAEVDISDYSPDPDNPLFVMYSGTPYQHLMIPIGSTENAGT